MKRATVLLLLLACIPALALLFGPTLLSSTHATAQGPKARHQWEYAFLMIEDTAVAYHWTTAKIILTTPGNVTKPDLDRETKDLYKKMGGKEANPTLFTILDLIGRDGWELVSYSHPPGAQTWWFKRALP